MKKAAMFGLDARIALAIFGALSVISGAALYSAIQQSKAVALYNELAEQGKAWEAYYLDTGQNLPQISTDSANLNFYILKNVELIEDSLNLKGWSGPYLQEEESSSAGRLNHNKYRDKHLVVFTDSNAWGEELEWVDDKCTSGKSCFIFSNIDGIPDDSLAKVIDELYDNGDGGKEGNFKWHRYGVSPYNYAYYLKIAPIANPND